MIKNALRLFGAAALAATLVPAGAAIAQSRGGPFYSATLSTPARAPRTVASALVWNCDGTSCTAPRGDSRPAVICARLVRSLGPVTAFSANGQALEATDLERCNAAAGH